MKEYIGTKFIKAKPMSKMVYNTLRGWKLPVNEDPKEQGYLVEYLDSPTPCHPDFDNYISWSPIEVFEEAYKQSGELSFGDAIYLMENGYKVQRKGWNGKGMYIQYYNPVANGTEELTILDSEPNGTTKPLLPFLMMKTADNMFVPWLASHSDMLAKDWCIYEC